MNTTEMNLKTDNFETEYDEIRALVRKSESGSDDTSKIYKPIIIALVAVILALAAAVIVMAIGWSNEQGTITPYEVIKEVHVTDYIAIDPNGENDHSLSDDSYMLSDTNYGPIWMPALANVAKNEYLPENFVKDELTGYLTYDDGVTRSVAGIDISKYQGDIDWNAVKEAGFEFVMIRCAYRGYVTGSLNADESFKDNVKGALDAGLDVGVYVFSQAIDVDEALEEAEFVLELIKDYDIAYPVVYDWEVVIDEDGDTARTKYITPEQLTANLLVFSERIAMEGYTPMVYCNKKTAVWKYDLSQLDGIDMWYAEYSDTPSYFYDFDMWQYSSKGSVPGIKGNVDLNISFKQYSNDE